MEAAYNAAKDPKKCGLLQSLNATVKVKKKRLNQGTSRRIALVRAARGGTFEESHCPGHTWVSPLTPRAE
ncbi:hypothetical protein TWF694_007829 [Orbilia ellipsospora]|uniref:Uncharacterized protein n=1 Tax=Orbilia ellipsospora TaxID=2528407 RepID=A0AAV9XIZ3_9PEZI